MTIATASPMKGGSNLRSFLRCPACQCLTPLLPDEHAVICSFCATVCLRLGRDRLRAASTQEVARLVDDLPFRQMLEMIETLLRDRAKRRAN